MLMTQSYIVNGNTSYIVEFDFDAEWSGFGEKTARFVYCDKQGARHWIDVPISGNTCNVPRLERVDKVEIGVSAGSIRTTSPARVICLRCITDIPSEAYAPPPDIYNTLMSSLQEVTHPLPQLPAGYAFVISAEGHYIVDVNGKFMIAKETS